MTGCVTPYLPDMNSADGGLSQLVLSRKKGRSQGDEIKQRKILNFFLLEAIYMIFRKKPCMYSLRACQKYGENAKCKM